MAKATKETNRSQLGVLACDLMLALPTYTFDIVANTAGAIHLEARPFPQAEPFYIVASDQGYTIDGHLYPTLDDAKVLLAP